MVGDNIYEYIVTKIKKASDKDRFLNAMRKIVSVSKTEIERREAQYRKMRAAAKKIEEDL